MMNIASRRSERGGKRGFAEMFETKRGMTAQVAQAFPESGRQPGTPEFDLSGLEMELEGGEAGVGSADVGDGEEGFELGCVVDRRVLQPSSGSSGSVSGRYQRKSGPQ